MELPDKLLAWALRLETIALPIDVVAAEARQLAREGMEEIAAFQLEINRLMAEAEQQLSIQGAAIETLTAENVALIAELDRVKAAQVEPAPAAATHHAKDKHK